MTEVTTNDIDSNPNDESTFLGKRLRSIRKERGLTIKTVSKRAGLSRTYLGQIETGSANPSIGTIKQVANVLGVSLVSLFDTNGDALNGLTDKPDPSDHEEVKVIRKNKRKTIGFPNSKGKTFLLSPDLQHKMEIILSTLPPGEGMADAYSHEGEEFGFVLEGKFEVNIAGKKFVLDEGDSIYFPSHLEHTTCVIGDKPATTLWVVTPPSF